MDFINWELLQRFVLVAISLALLVFGSYLRFNRNRSHAATFTIFGFGVFSVTALLHQSNVSMGFAFGLFAIFSMLRYRTESISVKEMTYLFVVIGISLLFAISNEGLLFVTIVVLCLISIVYVLERIIFKQHSSDRIIQYERIDFVHLDRHQELKSDLQDRTGWSIEKINILQIDFVKEIATLKVSVNENPLVSQEGGNDTDGLDAL